jgi:hypothetical protein
LILRQNFLIEQVEAVDRDFSCLNGFNFSLPMSRLLVIFCLGPVLSEFLSCVFSFHLNLFDCVGCSISNDDNHRKRHSFVVFDLLVCKLETYFNSFILPAALNLELIIEETSEAIRV